MTTHDLMSSMGRRPRARESGHNDPGTTRRTTGARHNLDKHPTYALAGLIAD